MFIIYVYIFWLIYIGYVFTEFVPIYQEALKNGGFAETLTYITNKNSSDNNAIETIRCKGTII